ncbi:MAG: Cryptic sugar kinase Mak [uncultured Friedmanniella sp.]|uniref:Cryptic sugar kinase Mak n=1 Tax=uncultured Friedmanniella sp. TaxID=335381 RepID=A0A6J4K1Y3_9ACTN|nr:MAG: Cryptic sugar kinase Mak [uncultured Friedmanniella sp.]
MLVGVDWGGTKIEVAALGEDGEQLARVRADTPFSDYEGCLALIAALVAQVESSTGRTGTIGVGLPGSLDPRTGLAKGASSTWLNGRPVEADLVRVLGREVRTSNDADCFAVSEAVDGSGAGHRVVLGVIIGTGTGAGIAIDGRAHHGPNNSAAEYGHNQLPRPDVSEIPGPPCYCGRHGCVERWVSGPSFARDYLQHAAVDLADPPRLTAKEILEQVRAGHRLSRLVWDRYLDRLARGLSIVVNTLDPDVIVLGGGMSNIPELYPELPSRVAAATFSPCFYTPILPATHGDSSGVRGAAWLWKD